MIAEQGANQRRPIPTVVAKYTGAAAEQSRVTETAKTPVFGASTRVQGQKASTEAEIEAKIQPDLEIEAETEIDTEIETGKVNELETEMVDELETEIGPEIEVDIVTEIKTPTQWQSTL